MHAQPEYNHYIITVDTASSIFSMNRCLVVPTKDIPPSDRNGNYPYRVNMNYDSTFLTVKFPGVPWLKLAFYKERRGSFVIHTDYLTGGLHSIEYINLLPLYAEIPGLFDSVQQGVTVQIRFQSYISIDEGAWYKIYSNVESLCLPPATGDDINFFNYLKGNLDNLDDIRDFAYSNGGVRFSGDHWGGESWDFLVNQYPNSILCDHAKYQYLVYKYEKRRELEGDSPELDLWRKNQRMGLRNSTKSDQFYDLLKSICPD
jgi:hypothetical protein